MELSLIIDQLADAIGEINTNSTPARRLVGGGVVVDAKGRLLIVYSDFAYQGWHFPKGGLDEGENSLQAAIREVLEECGDVRAKPYSGNIKFELQPGRVLANRSASALPVPKRSKTNRVKKSVSALTTY